MKFNKLLVVPVDFRGFSPLSPQLCHIKDELHIVAEVMVSYYRLTFKNNL